MFLLAFTDDRAWFSRRNAGFAGRGEIVTDALSKLFSFLTIGKGFESGSLHQLHSLKGIFPICVHMCSLYRKKSSQSACFNYNICPRWTYNFAFFPTFFMAVNVSSTCAWWIIYCFCVRLLSRLQLSWQIHLMIPLTFGISLMLILYSKEIRQNQYLYKMGTSVCTRV